MSHRRTDRVKAMTGIGVDKMGDLAAKDIGQSEAAAPDKTALRLENLDTDVPPHPQVAEITSKAIVTKEDNSYLPFIGQLGLRQAAAAHVTRATGGVVSYNGEDNCVITAGGLSGILNVLFSTVNPGEGVVMTDPTYAGYINRVKLVGAVPILVPLDFKPGGLWEFNSQKLREVVKNSGTKVTAMLLMSPALPSGCYMEHSDWQAVARICAEHDLMLIYTAPFERLLFDGRKVLHPASLPGMADRTVTVGTASKELRMIGWRVGWVVGPKWLMSDVGLVGMANVVVPVGIAQKAAKAALEDSHEDVGRFAKELEARRDLLMEELKGLPVGLPAGGWSFIIRVGDLGWTGKEASQALAKHGIYVTAMDGWGEEHGSQYIRIVFSNEPLERLKGFGRRFREALKITT